MLSAVSASEKRVVFMGNSITEFWEAADRNFFKENNYINRGISGQTTPQMLARFSQDVIALKPAAVVILAGINDIAENTGPISLDSIFKNIVLMVKSAQQQKIRVIMCSVLPANGFPWNTRIDPKEKITALNHRLRNFAKENQISFADYYPAMVDTKGGIKAGFADDGVHPNSSGYQVMKPILQAAIQQSLK